MQQSSASHEFLDRLQSDQSQRWATGERRLVEAYLADHAQLAENCSAVLDLICHEVVLRESQGEAPRAEEYAARFPHLTPSIHRLFEVHQALEGDGGGEDTPRGAQAAAEESTGGDPAQRKTVDFRRERPAPSTQATSARATDSLRRCGDYELISEISRGGMGVVYRARQISLDRPVALKMILAGGHAGKDETDRFRTEAQAAGQLDHVGIVPVYGHGTEEGTPYLAMALIEGQSLAQRVRETPLAPRAAAEIMQKVAEAVHYAHARGVVHRDLKPANILLAAGDQPKVTDFGLAKRVAVDASLTRAGEIMGTPSFMPPEQARGDWDHVGPQADVYSLGATLYALVTGRPPFQTANPLDTLKQVLEEEPLSPRALNPAVDIDLETICLKCLQKRPADRYGSAEALAEDLGRHLRNEPIVARPVSFAEQAWRWCARNPVVAGLGSTAIALLAVVAVVASVAYFQQQDFVTKLTAANLVKDQALQQKGTALEEKSIALQKESAALTALQKKNADLIRTTAMLQNASDGWQGTLTSLLEHFATISPDDRRIGDVLSLQRARDTMRRAMRDYEAMLRESGTDDPAMHLRLATGLEQLAHIAREAQDPATASETYLQAERVVESLLLKRPKDKALTQKLAQLYNDHGLAETYAGNSDEGAALQLKSIKLQEELAAAGPLNKGQLEEQAMGLSNLGIGYAHKRDWARAREAYVRALEIFDKLAAEGSVTAVLFQSQVDANFAKLEVYEGDQEGSHQRFLNALRRLDRLVEKHQYLRSQEFYLEIRGMVLVGLAIGHLKDKEQTKKYVEEAVDIWETLVTSNPKTIKYKLALIRALSMQAMLLVEDDPQEALKLCGELIAASREIQRDSEGFALVATELGRAQGAVALALAKINDYENALVNADAALATYGNMPPQVRATPEIDNMVRTMIGVRPMALLELGRWGEALPELEKSEFMKEKAPFDREFSMAICRAGLKKEYVGAMFQAMQAAVKYKRVLDYETESTINALSSAAALEDPDEDLDDELREKRSLRFARAAIDILRKKLELVDNANDVARFRFLLDVSPRYAGIRQREDFVKFRGEAEEKLEKVLRDQAPAAEKSSAVGRNAAEPSLLGLRRLKTAGSQDYTPHGSR